ncbi:DUF1146 family protein [Convivina intestini]|nr:MULTISPECIES: DUF1146 family protein [Convivina]
MLLIYLVFMLLKPINFAKIMPYTPRQAALLKVVLATVLGFLLALFFITIAEWIFQLPSSILKH